MCAASSCGRRAAPAGRTGWPARARRPPLHDVVLSTGPGDPDPCAAETARVPDLTCRVPVFGICLGHQLRELTTAHETFKLPVGHRGTNHPVLERAGGRVLGTSQN